MQCARCLREHGGEYDRVSWVPLSRRRLRERGYDQARLLAVEVSRRTGIPCERLLRKIRSNPAQSGIGGPAKRRMNVAGVYRACAAEITAGRRILLVDDIVTTGATLSECASVLTGAGAKEVLALTLASTRDARA